jgi:hypothetical protein
VLIGPALRLWRALIDTRHLVPRDWHAEDRAGPRAFGGWLARLQDVFRDFHPAEQERMLSSLNALLSAMEEDEGFRERCFVVAEESASSCDDNLLLGLNRFDMTLQDHRAERGEMSELELYALGRTSFRLGVLESLAERKVAALRTGPHPPDPVEVHLAYQVGLRETLELPIPVSRMNFWQLSGVSQWDLGAALHEVVLAESGVPRVSIRRYDQVMRLLEEGRIEASQASRWQALAAYLAESYSPWRAHVARLYPAEALLHAERAYKSLEAIEARHTRGEINEGEYLNLMALAQRYANFGLAYQKALECALLADQISARV